MDTRTGQTVAAPAFRVRLSTDAVPEGERFAYWREAICEQTFGVSSDPIAPGARAHRAEVDASVRGAIKLFRFRSDRAKAFRGRREIARLGWDDFVMLYRERGRGASFQYSGGEFVTQTGDLAVTDPSLPFATDAAQSYDHHAWILPRRLIEPHLPKSARITAFSLKPDGVTGLIRAYLDACSAEIDTLDEPACDVVADSVCRLLAVACGAAAGEHREPIRVARLNEVKRHIAQHLADPNLTPEQAARALKISTRQLHLLFEPSGATFRQYVLTRRLEECRTALLGAGRERSVTDIAFGWGFNSLATFYRTFHEAYGCAPGELRAEALLKAEDRGELLRTKGRCCGARSIACRKTGVLTNVL